MVYIGTSGYSYKDWIGPFYPSGTKDASMLEYYSGHFNFVEINSSYYHMPRLQLFESLRRKTPEGFKFSVKLFGGFTHERKSGALEAEQFKYAVRPLVEDNKLVCLLAQFPYSFHCNQENADYLKRIREWFHEYEVSVEFRNQGWIRSEVMNVLKKENLGFVCVDEPGIKGLVRGVTAFTSGVSYLRMHGRNSGMWYEGQGSERYDYLYSTEELYEWIPRIKDMESNTNITIVTFNNHPRGRAVQNANMLTGLL